MGVSHYDVRYKSESRGWTDWQVSPQATQAVFTGPGGHTYTFRVSATDGAGNESGWQTSGQVTVPLVKKYYAAAGRRVAMRAEGVVYYLHGDHLGSTSLVTTGAGAEVARQMYLPYGAPRWGSGTLPTDFTFTGQRADSYIKLIQMGARWYDADLGRWISPDSIVPQPGNPQALNRYSYVNNRPLKFVDPTGHYECEGVDCRRPSPLWQPGKLTGDLPKLTDLTGHPERGDKGHRDKAKFGGDPSLPPPEGRFFGLTSSNWSAVGIFFDTVALGWNGIYAIEADAGFYVASAFGHPEAGLAWYASAVLEYQATSIIPNSISTVGWGCTVASGIASGENSASYDGKRLSVSVSQDTAYATPFMAAGWLIRDPNLGTTADALVVIYDLLRVGSKPLMPAYINPTLTIEQNQNSGFSTGFNWRRP